MTELGIKLLTPTAKLPTRSYDKSLGYDLYVDSVEELSEHYSEIIKVHTGISIQFPEGYGGIIFDRSGIALQGYFVVAGVIDNSYRNEIIVIMHKDKYLDNPTPGTKIAQLVLIPTPTFEIIEYQALSDTERGKRGFGSSDE